MLNRGVKVQQGAQVGSLQPFSAHYVERVKAAVEGACPGAGSGSRHRAAEVQVQLSVSFSYSLTCYHPSITHPSIVFADEGAIQSHSQLII
jgi:hypothetical protein